MLLLVLIPNYIKRMSTTFQRTIESFICGHCGQAVQGDGYTNHCPYCLYSRHVDNSPGDRQADCGGLMKPVRIEMRGSEYMIVHICELCGLEKRNKVGKGDEFEKVLSLAKDKK